MKKNKNNPSHGKHLVWKMCQSRDTSAPMFKGSNVYRDAVRKPQDLLVDGMTEKL